MDVVSQAPVVGKWHPSQNEAQDNRLLMPTIMMTGLFKSSLSLILI